MGIPSEPSPAIRSRAAAVLGWAPWTWRRVQGGYTPAARFVGARGKQRCFLKVATNPVTAAMIRREARSYAVVRGAFAPEFFGWDDDPVEPLLLIEDLSEATWPPPWTSALVDRVLGQIHAMHSCSVDLPRFSAADWDPLGGWSTVATDPKAFLSLGLTSAAWLRDALPRLVEAEAQCVTTGAALTHFDLRSDNICITDTGPKFIDWAEACRGDPALDLGAWLPSLEREGGPPPDAILPDRPEVAAWISGYFAARAGLPRIPDGPRVRDIQKDQLLSALPWAKRALGLPD
jgi:thiamine kinase-like enzyme